MLNRPVRAVKDPSHEPVKVPSRTQHEKSLSQKIGMTLFISFYFLKLETTQAAGKLETNANGVAEPHATKRVRRIPLTSTQ